jgi:serine/threonine protein kinase
MEYMDLGNLLSYVVHNGRNERDTVVVMQNQGRNSPIKNGGLPEDIVKNLTVQLLCGVQYLHETCQIKHGDIHPANILLSTQQGTGDDTDNESCCMTNEKSLIPGDRFLRDKIRLKLTDFGSSEQYTPEMNNKLSLTRSAIVNDGCQQYWGSQGRKSIDLSRLKQDNYTTYKNRDDLFTNILADDMWDVGIVVYYMLSGHMPFGMNKHMLKKQSKPMKDGSTTSRDDFKIRFPAYFSRYAKQFLCYCFQFDPTIRMTASEALDHSWLKDTYGDYVIDKVTERFETSNDRRNNTMDKDLYKAPQRCSQYSKVVYCGSKFLSRNSEYPKMKEASRITYKKKHSHDMNKKQSHGINQSYSTIKAIKQSWQYFMGSSTSSMEGATAPYYSEDDDYMSTSNSSTSHDTSSSMVGAATTTTSRTIKVSNRNFFSPCLISTTTNKHANEIIYRNNTMVSHSNTPNRIPKDIRHRRIVSIPWNQYY